ncbi:hypothetical protein NP233_g5307 [Leucocoprinus birnbaumii]|uniref:F-box domain-containing protein n=1 Tax=Leucocoprinus birnbaumii TaxID=56174 RepID=A0AAD5VUI3_9AGAR|nr:hypothetical protein NP233_g5307 [Leucocoprinus birnbaumii]
MNDTPYDVWSLVTSFLPRNDVENLCGVNKQLRELGLDARFGEVKFDKHDSGMKRLCEMLSRDEVATHVKKLTIEPWLVQPRTKTYVSRSENLWNRVNTFFNSGYMQQEAEKRVQKRINKDIMRVTSAVQRLNRVDEYQISYNERSTKHHRQLFEAFLSPTLEAFGSTLAKLTIKVPYNLLQQLSYVRLPQLREFDIYLCTGVASMDKVKYALDGFFVFVHNLQSLEHLGISATSCSRNLDLSYFSARWGTFPHLKSFSLCIPFNGGLLSSPEDFYEHLIKPHAGTLEKLKLSTSCGGLAPQGSLDPACHYWIQRILRSSFKTPFPRLREVELALRPLKAELTDLHTFLQLHSASLQNLCLTDRALNIQELDQIFESLERLPGHRNDVLETLGVKMEVLDARTLVLIAHRLPQLKALNLAFTDLMEDAKVPEQARSRPQLRLARYQDSFAKMLGPYSIPVFFDWQLRYLNLIESPSTTPWINGLAHIFRDYFPPTVQVGQLPALVI